MTAPHVTAALDQAWAHTAENLGKLVAATADATTLAGRDTARAQLAEYIADETLIQAPCPQAAVRSLAMLAAAAITRLIAAEARECPR
jgi:hypothetical protein